MPPTVLFVDNLADMFLSHRLPLALALRDAGAVVEVAVPEGPAVARIGAVGFLVRPFPLDRRSMGPAGELRTLLALIALMKASRPEVVHLRTIKPVIYGGWAARLAGVPAVISHITGLGYAFLAEGLRAQVLRGLLRPAYKLAFSHPRQRVIFQNADDRRCMLGLGLLTGERTVIIRGSGVDPDQYPLLPTPAGPVPLVVLPARMLWDKGVGEFVESARVLRRQGVAIRMVLVGQTDDGNPACVPEARLRAWVDEGIVEWWGRRDDMIAVYAQADVVCLPSYGEGLPRVLLEAMACGRPVVTCDVAGCREPVIDGRTGLLVPARDPAGLAAALAELADDRCRRQAMGQAARELLLTEFTSERVVRETLAVYRELLGDRWAPPALAHGASAPGR